ncbi:MAG TPA: biotin/lipoyl-binding protein, partial [Candidatus Xenobia bacterium]
MKRRAPVIVLAVILLTFAWWYSQRPTHPSGTIEGSGTIEATQVDLAPQVSGRVVRITVIEGDVVKAGATLAELDGVAQKDALRQAQANVAQAVAHVQEAQANLDLQARQYAANLSQAEAAAQSNVPRVPQAAESTRLQEGTVVAQIHLVEAQVNSARATLAAATGNA